MADTKLTGLTELTSVALDDWVYVVDKSDTTDDAEGSSRKVSVPNLIKPVNKLIQRVYTSFSSDYSTTGTIPYDNTIPQNTEGTELGTLSITPTSTNNYLKVSAFFPMVGNNTAALNVVSLFKDSGANALQTCSIISTNAQNDALSIQMTYIEQASSTSSQTWKLRYGANVGTMYLNRAGLYTLFGSSLPIIFFEIEEFAP